MLIGVASTDISPPLGTALAGYFRVRISDQLHSPLIANALVAGEGANKVAVIACDLITITKELSEQVRQIVAAKSDLAAANIMVCATHTHTGPELRAGKLHPRNEEYMQELPGRIAQAAILANANQRQAVCCLGTEPESGLAFNRRFRLKDGSEITFGADPEKLAGVAGPTDPAFTLACFKTDLEASPFAIICNYSLHIDVQGGNAISADYPAVLRNTLRKIYGEELVVLFLQGACGDINHVPYLQNNPFPKKGIWKSEQVGKALAGKALCISEKALPSNSEETGSSQEILQVPKFPKNDPAYAMRLKQAQEAKEPNSFEQSLLDRHADYDDSGLTEREVQTLRIGDLAICGAPGEYFVEWGLEIKKWSPAPYTVIAELCNDSAGYIPTYETFLRGGYECTPVVSVTSSPALGQMIADANFRNLRRLFAKAQPEQ